MRFLAWSWEPDVQPSSWPPVSFLPAPCSTTNRLSAGEKTRSASLAWVPTILPCWSPTDTVQLGLGAGVQVEELSAGTAHVCALLTDGSVKCWGNNSHGQLGIGDPNNRGYTPDEMGAKLLAVDLGGPKIEATDPDASDVAVDSGTFTVTLDAAAQQDLVIPYTVGGTAKPNQDYAALSGSVTIPAGQTSATVSVTPLADTWIEGEGGAETVIITLDDIAFGSATLNIADAPLPDCVCDPDQRNDRCCLRAD